MRDKIIINGKFAFKSKRPTSSKLKQVRDNIENLARETEV